MKKQTKPAWGIVAVIGVMVAVTMGDNFIMAGIGTALLGLGAYLGGYMNEASEVTSEATSEVGERRAA